MLYNVYLSRCFGKSWIKNHPHKGWFFHYLRMIQRDLTLNSNQTNGGVRGGTIRLLPVDSKAEAKRSSLYTSQEPPAQTTPKLK